MRTSHACRRTRCGGFTLIELLIVIGVIALLLGILLPTVGMVRESGRTAVCMSNLNQVGKAATGYSVKYNGFLVPGYADPVVKESGGNSIDTENYATMLVNEKFVEAPDIETLGSQITTRASVFRCPSGNEDVLWMQFSDKVVERPKPDDRKSQICNRPWRTKSKRSNIVVDTWYGINGTIQEFAKWKTPYRRIPDDKNTTDFSLYTINDMKDASRTVFLYDGVFSDLQYDADRISARHNGQRITNILFADGHVEAIPTASLPGGMGPNGTSDIFTKAAPPAGVGLKPTYVWRLDNQ